MVFSGGGRVCSARPARMLGDRGKLRAPAAGPGLRPEPLEHAVMGAHRREQRRLLVVLFTERGDYSNFHLRAEVSINEGGNSGMYFRTKFGPGFPAGYEAQVNSTHADKVKTGSLYHVKDVGIDDIKEIVKDNEWFTEHIIVRDNTVTIKLNGKEVVNWTQPPDWNGGREGQGRVLSHGTIALQGHDPKSTVHYKNIRVKALP